MFHELDTVALTRDVPEHGLKAGAEGIVLLTHDWAAPQGLTLEFFVGDDPWSPESDEDYPSLTISLPADQVRLVKSHEPRIEGQMSADQVQPDAEKRACSRSPRHPSR